MPALVGLSAAKAQNFYGLVYPRETWWTKVGAMAINLYSRLQRSPYRFFIHPSAAVDAVIRAQGFTPRLYRKTYLWQVVVYGR